MEIIGRITFRSVLFLAGYEAVLAILSDRVGVGTSMCIAIMWHLPLAIAILIRKRAAVALWCASAHLAIFISVLWRLRDIAESDPHVVTIRVLEAMLYGLSCPVIRIINGDQFPRGGFSILVVVFLGAATFAAVGAGFSWSLKSTENQDSA